MPPTPTKTSYVRRTGKRRKYRPEFEDRSLSASPNKKRRISAPLSAKKSPSVDRKLKETKESKFFRNLGMIGCGSFAKVFKVENAFNKQVFALKKASSHLYTKEAIEDAMNEIRIMQTLQKKQNDSKKE